MNHFKHLALAFAVTLLFQPAAFASQPASKAAPKNEEQKSDELEKALARAGSSCKLEPLIKRYQKEGDITRLARTVVILGLLKSAEFRELVPKSSIDDINTLQRNLVRSYISQTPALGKSFYLVDKLRQIELALSNYAAAEQLFEQNQKNHAKQLKVDGICYRFLHQAFIPVRLLKQSDKAAMANLRKLHKSCQRSAAQPSYKSRAQKTFNCLKVINRPFNKASEYDILYNNRRCAS